MPRTPTKAIPKEELSYLPQLGPTLARHRKAFGYSQEEAAKKVGITQRQVSRYENNQVRGPDAENLLKLGVLYGLTPNTIAKLAGWWYPTDPENVANPKWDYIRNFLNSKSSQQAKDHFIDLAYAACRAVESLDATGELVVNQA